MSRWHLSFSLRLRMKEKSVIIKHFSLSNILLISKYLVLRLKMWWILRCCKTACWNIQWSRSECGCFTVMITGHILAGGTLAIGTWDFDQGLGTLISDLVLWPGFWDLTQGLGTLTRDFGLWPGTWGFTQGLVTLPMDFELSPGTLDLIQGLAT